MRPMKFLSAFWLPFWAFLIIRAVVFGAPRSMRVFTPADYITAIWLVVNCLVTPVYLIARIFQRARSDGGRQR